MIFKNFFLKYILLIGNVNYKALPPKQIVFKALNQAKECDASELMTIFAVFFKKFLLNF